MYIYCLINPIDGNVFYVGRTASSLRKRLLTHVRDAKAYKKPNFAKNDLIREILKSGSYPLVEQLEYCRTCNESLSAERFWIYQYETVFGYKLVNKTLTRWHIFQTASSKSLLMKLIKIKRA